jgi:hypothetical protein
LMITGHVYDHAARLRSYGIVAEIRDRLVDVPSRNFTPAFGAD